MQFDIITIFPKILKSYYNESIIGRALNKKKIQIKYHNLRDFTNDKHKSVDDTPYGGGPGMILKAEPIIKALQSIKRQKKSKIIMLDPKGKIYDQKTVTRFSKLNQIIFVNGYYEGIDARIDKFIDEKISMGKFVLSNSELATAMIIDSTTRLLPEVLGNADSLKNESFTDHFIEHPQYTKPEEIKIKNKTYKVPQVLLSGHHAKIKEWQEKNSPQINHIK
jgi:tRNA (guanine37-N1)-methyltransferase